MGIICLYVLIQKSGQKTAKSHLCAMGKILLMVMGFVGTFELGQFQILDYIFQK